MSRLLLRIMACTVLGALTLSACGKKGEPHAPGPASAITYPRTYPAE